MTVVQAEDNRNQEWRKNNKGSSLLQKMGWKEGEGLGKRAKNSCALRVIKRKDGLGLGATLETEGEASQSNSHFASVLESLKAHHAAPSAEETKKRKAKKEEKKAKKKRAKEAKKAKKSLSLAKNKVTAGHAKKIRESKFREHTAADLACIFATAS